MTPDQLTHYLHRQIPLSAAMQVRIEEATEDLVRIRAPLLPNINHHQTLFGGSGASILTLAAWTLIHLRLRDLEGEFDLVIAEGSVQYLRPVKDDFEVLATSQGLNWEHFAESLVRKGRGRAKVHSKLFFEGNSCAEFTGKFVAIQT